MGTSDLSRKYGCQRCRLAGRRQSGRDSHLVMPIKVVIAVSYTGLTSSGVGFASVATDNGMSISFRHGSRSWSAKIGKENCCDILELYTLSIYDVLASPPPMLGYACSGTCWCTRQKGFTDPLTGPARGCLLHLPHFHRPSTAAVMSAPRCRSANLGPSNFVVSHCQVDSFRSVSRSGCSLRPEQSARCL